MDRARRNDTSTTIRRVVLLSGVREKESNSRRSTEGSFVVEKAEIERVIDDLETKRDDMYEQLEMDYVSGIEYAINQLKDLIE